METQSHTKELQSSFSASRCLLVSSFSFSVISWFRPRVLTVRNWLQLFGSPGLLLLLQTRGFHFTWRGSCFFFPPQTCSAWLTLNDSSRVSTNVASSGKCDLSTGPIRNQLCMFSNEPPHMVPVHLSLSQPSIPPGFIPSGPTKHIRSIRERRSQLNWTSARCFLFSLPSTMQYTVQYHQPCIGYFKYSGDCLGKQEETGEKAQWLKSPVALAEAPGLIPRNYMAAHNHL